MSTLNEKTNHYPAGWEAAEEARKDAAAAAISAELESKFFQWRTKGGQYDRFAFPISNAVQDGDPIYDPGDDMFIVYSAPAPPV